MLLGRQDNQTARLVQELEIPDWAHELELTAKRCYDTSEGFSMVYDTFTIAIEEFALDGLALTRPAAS